MFKVEFDTTVLSERLKAIHAAMVSTGQGSDMNALLKDEAGRLIVLVSKFTPPMGAGGRSAGAKQAGEHAIESELNSLISEASYELIDEIGSRHGISDVRTFLTKKDGSKLDIVWNNVDPTGDRLKEYHNKYRGPRGKIARIKQRLGVWHSRIVVPEGKRAPYIAKVRQKVGRWRASICAGLPQLGVRVPRWISRHFGSIDDIAILDLSMMNDPVHPSIEFGTRAPGVGDPSLGYKRQMHGALASRLRSLKKRAQLILNGYAKDINNRHNPVQGRVAQSTSEPHPEIEE